MSDIQVLSLDLSDVLPDTIVFARNTEGLLTRSKLRFQVEADGAIRARAVETVTEGDITRDVNGVRFQWTARRHGRMAPADRLYQRCLEGQIGVDRSKPYDWEEFRKGTQRQLDALKIGSEAVLESLAASVESYPAPGTTRLSLYPLYRDLYTQEAQSKLAKVNNSCFIQEDVDTGEVTESGEIIYMKTGYPAMFGHVRVRNRVGREEAIGELIRVTNLLAERGLLRGAMVPLASVLLGSIEDGVKHIDELILTYLHIPTMAMEKIKAEFPNLFQREGEYPTPWGTTPDSL